MYIQEIKVIKGQEDLWDEYCRLPKNKKRVSDICVTCIL